MKIVTRANYVEEEIDYAWNRLKNIRFYDNMKYNLSLPSNEKMNCLI